MSLRQRLVVVLLLGFAALVVAFLAVGHVLSATDAARERNAEAAADTGAQALVDALGARVGTGAAGEPLDPDQRRSLQQTAGSVLRPVANAAGGFCSRDGDSAIVVSMGRSWIVEPGAPPSRRGGGRSADPHLLSSDLRDAVLGLCRSARSGDPARARVEHARDVELVSALPAGERWAAWFVVRVRTKSGSEIDAWPLEVVLLAAVAIGLVVVTIDAMLALGRGADQLKGALTTLETDLRAPVPRPRARELGEIGQGLATMAAHLADARDRERSLEATLARDQRLAALGRVAAGIAHEVRNPLAGMKLRLDLLDRAPDLPGEAREDVTACLGEIARLDRLVETLLSASRTRARPPERIDLAAFADERVASAAPLAAPRGVTIRREGDAAAMGDRDVLAAAADNLIRNAVEASPEGGEVVVRLAAGEDAPSLAVEDRGPGVPEDRRAELFEPFFTTKAEGTGLGLWVSRLLLEARGGSLAYEREGGTTRMVIRLAPVADA